MLAYQKFLINLQNILHLANLLIIYLLQKNLSFFQINIKKRMSKQVSKQTTIVFEPLCIESKFQKQLGLQIAFYRSNIILIKHSDDKVKKIDPIKLSQPQKVYNFNSKDSAMKLHTLLNHNEQQDKVQNKQFKVQVIFKIDGNKNSIQKQIDASHYYKKSKEINSLKLTNKPQTQLKFRIHIFLKDDKEKERIRPFATESLPSQKQRKMNEELNFQNARSITPVKNIATSKSIPKPILTNKSLKVIKFEDDKNLQDNNEKNQVQRGKRTNTGRILQGFKTQSDLQRISNDETGTLKATNKKLQLKLQSVEKELNQKTKELSKISLKFTQLQTKYRDLGLKFQKVSDKCTQLSLQKERWQSKDLNTSIETSQSDLKKQREKYQKLQRQYKKLRQQMGQLSKKLQNRQNETKKILSQNKTLQEINKKNETKVKQLKQQNIQFEKLLVEIQGKNLKSAGNSLQQSLKPYKQRIKILQRQNQDLQEEKNYAEEQSKSKKDEVLQLKQKIKSLNDENLKLTEDLSHQEYEMQKLTKKVKDLQVQVKEYKEKIDMSDGGSIQDHQEFKNKQQDESNYGKFKTFRTQKVIGGSGADSIVKLKAQNAQLKTKLSIALKNLQNKENLLKKFDAFSKEGRKQLQDELQKIKKQNQQLKDKLSSKQSGPKNDLISLQTRMQLEKVKKQLQYKTKSQRQLLVEKSQLESRNKTLQEDVVKSKESIANILNAIHQHGDQGLIEDVNMFLC